MTTYPYLNAWLQCLLQLAPPRGLVHIGAGGGAQPYPYAHMPRLLAVEADARQHARLQMQLQNHAHRQVTQAVVAAQPGTTDFYALSQSFESGLCPTATLQTLWPNIKTLQADAVSATTLQALLTQAPDGAAAFNWAVIDCLPADQLLQGAGDLIQGWDVLVIRALRDAPAGANTATQAMSLAALRQQLAAFDLEFVALEEENHPQMVRALFVHNHAQQQVKDKATFTAALQEQTQLTTESQATVIALEAQQRSLEQQKSNLIAANEELTAARDQLGIQRDAEAQAKAEALAQRDQLSQDKAALAAARDEQAKLAAERQAALTNLQAQYEGLAQEKSNLIAVSEEMKNAATSKQQYMQQLEAVNQENAFRQRMQREELIKAEAQIDLIKDLLLREPGI